MSGAGWGDLAFLTGAVAYALHSERGGLGWQVELPTDDDGSYTGEIVLAMPSGRRYRFTLEPVDDEAAAG